jgi:type III secretion protein C
MNLLHQLRTALLLGALACASGAVAAAASGAASSSFTPVASIPWPESPFATMNTGQKLDKLLASFAQAFGLQLQLDDPLPDEAPPSGRTGASSPTEFLNQLGATHGLLWYHRNGTLHVSRSSTRQIRAVTTKGLSGSTLRRVLAEMGLFESKFGWSEIPERNIVMVSGPATYVDRIQATIEALPEADAEQQIQVYRLRYAPVDDRVISYRDKSITTPGVATILRNLVSGLSGGGTSTEIADLAAPLVTPMRPAPSLGAEPEQPGAKPPVTPTTPGAAGGSDRRGDGRTAPVIQADTRLNAIIVKDRPQNVPIYRALIERLDVPSSLIEIEAMIVDINASDMGDLGIDWSARHGNTSVEAGPAGNITLAHGAIAAGSAATSMANFILARIRALEGKGSARIVSRPSILTQDNMGALIDLSDTFYIQTTGERVANVTPVSVGVSLRVTPRVVGTGDNRAIQLVVDIEDGGIQDLKIGSLPTVRRSSISTQALMNETQSLVIGGFNAERNMKQRDQVPLLGDIPVVGAAFSRDTQTTEKRERVFLITPRIVALQPLAARNNE